MAITIFRVLSKQIGYIIFIYDFSCNNSDSIKNSSLPLVDLEILPYDVDNHAQINCPDRLKSVYNTSAQSQIND
jgi:hypothetical protein